jgi:Fanconi anemia group M protein
MSALPALKIPLLVDARERPSRLFDLALASNVFDVRVASLRVGDYLVADAVLIERKTAFDFAASLVDGRLFPQAALLARQDARGVFLLEGALPPTAPRVHPHALKGAAISLAVMWRLPVLFAHSPEDSLLVLQLLGEQVSRLGAPILKRPDARPTRLASRRLFVLQGLPGVGPALSRRLLGTFATIERVMTADAGALTAVKGIGPRKAAAIRKVLT